MPIWPKSDKEWGSYSQKTVKIACKIHGGFPVTFELFFAIIPSIMAQYWQTWHFFNITFVARDFHFYEIFWKIEISKIFFQKTPNFFSSLSLSLSLSREWVMQIVSDTVTCEWWRMYILIYYQGGVCSWKKKHAASPGRYPCTPSGARLQRFRPGLKTHAINQMRSQRSDRHESTNGCNCKTPPFKRTGGILQLQPSSHACHWVVSDLYCDSRDLNRGPKHLLPGWPSKLQTLRPLSYLDCWEFQCRKLNLNPTTLRCSQTVPFPRRPLAQSSIFFGHMRTNWCNYLL